MIYLNKNFSEKLDKIEKSYDELKDLLSSVEIISDNKLYMYYKKKFSKIEKISENYKDYKNYIRQINVNEQLLKTEKDISFLAELKLENSDLMEKIESLIVTIKTQLQGLNFEETQKIRIEINLKTGEKEKINTYFDMIKNYQSKFAESFDIEKQTENSLIVELSGNNVFEDMSIFIGNSRILQFEKESFFGISVLKIEENKFELDWDDITIETLKSGGAGGQHINKTESAIRLIHNPTKISVICQDERSQLQNKQRAFENLKIKINEYYTKNIKKNIEIQRKNIKNALFSTTPTTIFDFDKNIFYCYKTEQNYKLKEILEGNLKIITRDIL